MPQVKMTAQEAANQWIDRAYPNIVINRNEFGYHWFDYKKTIPEWHKGFLIGMYQAYQSVYLLPFAEAMQTLLEKYLTTNEKGGRNDCGGANARKQQLRSSVGRDSEGGRRLSANMSNAG